MELETMRPNPVWDADSYDDAVTVFESMADEIVVKVWGGDWCGDCRSQLPDFGAALEAAGVESVEHHPVEKTDDGSKVGPGVEEYDIDGRRGRSRDGGRTGSVRGGRRRAHRRRTGRPA